MAGDEPWSEPQNLGEGFQFEEDEEALQSILENRGHARTQVSWLGSPAPLPLTPRPSPAEKIGTKAKHYRRDQFLLI